MLKGRLAKFLKMIWEKKKFKQKITTSKGFVTVGSVFWWTYQTIFFIGVTHVDLIVDLAFQRRTQQHCDIVSPLSEGCIGVLHVHNLFIPVVEVMGSWRQVSGLQFTGVGGKKKKISLEPRYVFFIVIPCWLCTCLWVWDEERSPRSPLLQQ